MKKLCTICIIFVILMLWIVLYPNYTFAVQNDPTTTNDSNYQVIQLFKSLDNMLVATLERSDCVNRSDLIGQLAYGRPYCWFIDVQNNNRAIYLALYDPGTSWTGGYTIDIYNDNNSQIMVDGYQLTTIHTFRIELVTNPGVYKIADNQQIYIPAVTYGYFGESVLQMLKDVGYINGDASLSDLQSGLAQINSSVVSEGNQTQQAIGAMQNATTGAIQQSSQQQQQAIGNMQNATTNSIGTMSNNIDNRLQQQQAQEQSNFNTLTNTTYYDNTTTVIDPSDFFETTSDPNDTSGFLETLYELVYDKFSNPSRSTVVVIPMPFGMDNISLDSSSVVDFYETYSIIGDLVTTFWYFIIGRYIFEFCRRIYLFFVTGAFADTSLLSEYLSMHNEIIKTYMM